MQVKPISSFQCNVKLLGSPDLTGQNESHFLPLSEQYPSPPGICYSKHFLFLPARVHSFLNLIHIWISKNTFIFINKVEK